MHTPYPADDDAQMPSWDDLHLLWVVIEHGSLTQAARVLGTTQPTVGRRLSALEERLGAPLVERSVSGCAPTELARLLLPMIGQMHAAAEGVLRAQRLTHNTLEGVVRIACGELIGRMLARHLHALVAEAPRLRVEVLAGQEVLNLARGEADVAVRAVHPEGDHWVTRKMKPTPYGIYASPAFLQSAPAARDPVARLAQCRWLTFCGHQRHMPSARWLDARRDEDAPTLCFDRSSLIVEAAASGAGLALLPMIVGDDDARLVRVDEAEGLSVSGWLVMHPSAARLPRVRHVARWLGQLMGDVRGSADQAPRT